MLQPNAAAVWALSERQHGVITRAQLMTAGYNRRAIEHRIATTRLQPLWRGAYLVGTRRPSRLARWMAAALTCGPEAVLSHVSAAGLWEIADEPTNAVHVSVPAHVVRRRPGIRVHRRSGLVDADRGAHLGIPVTSPALTLVDLATTLPPGPLETAVNRADGMGRIDPETLRRAVERMGGRPGTARLRVLLDRRTFRLTDSALERLMLPILAALDLPPPETRARVNGFRVDFFWPELGLVIETDGLRYHRTPAQQARDRLRDQAHSAAGLVPLRFTHAQVRYEPGHVRETIGAVLERIRAARDRA